jgi:hypothetical protein
MCAMTVVFKCGKTHFSMKFRYEKNWQQTEEMLQPEQTSMGGSVLVYQVLQIKFNAFKICNYKSGTEKIVYVRLL